jgi:hypothetical protein
MAAEEETMTGYAQLLVLDTPKWGYMFPFYL